MAFRYLHAEGIRLNTVFDLPECEQTGKLRSKMGLIGSGDKGNVNGVTHYIFKWGGNPEIGTKNLFERMTNRPDKPS